MTMVLAECETWSSKEIMDVFFLIFYLLMLGGERERERSVSYSTIYAFIG